MPKMVFHRLGNAYHLDVDSAGILARIHELDPARWAVTSLPIRELQCDPSLAKALDPNGKGRILVDQLIGGRDWAFRRIARVEAFDESSDTLRLSDLRSGDPEAELLLRAALRLIAETKPPATDSITLEQVRSYRSSFINSPANGDGVVPAESVADEEGARLVGAIVATTGGAKDLSGRDGVGEAHLASFSAGAAAWLAWKAKENSPNLFPWRGQTAAAAQIVAAIDSKIDQYFAQCELVRQEPAALKRFALTESELATLAVTDPGAINARLRDMSLAMPRADGVFDFGGAVNPAWEDQINLFRTEVLATAFPGFDGALTEQRWAEVKALFRPWRDWQAAKPAGPWESLDPSTLTPERLAEPLARIREAISADGAAAPELAKINDLEKLIVLQRWLLELCNNFVGLLMLFDPKRRALFEVGTLVIDGRRLEFCMKVPDRAAHKKVASESKAYLIYTQIFEKEGGAPLFEVVAPVTRGEKNRLLVGKRGIFIANDGRVLDAVIAEVVENPISVWEAAKAPFLRVAAFINKKIEDFAGSKMAAAEKQATDNLSAPLPPPVPAGAPNQRRDYTMMAGVLAGGGLALAAVGSALAYMAQALANIDVLGLLLALVVIVAVIAGFAGFLGWLKLRLRDAGPLLEANGWAINPKLRISGLLASSFNRFPPLPEGHEKSLVPHFHVPEDDMEDEEPIDPNAGPATAKRADPSGKLLVIGLIAIVGFVVLHWLRK